MHFVLPDIFKIILAEQSILKTTNLCFISITLQYDLLIYFLNWQLLQSIFSFFFI